MASMAYKDLTGQRFGMLTVTGRCGLDVSRKNAMWFCLCDCGDGTITSTSHLKSGHTKSCGCQKGATENNIATRLQPTHGMSRTRLYKTWLGMRARCNNPNNPKYDLYGGRGIMVCEEWLHDFVPFHDWAMANGYRDDLTIDRIDCDGNYEPSNCRWATITEQNRNRRNAKGRCKDA